MSDTNPAPQKPQPSHQGRAFGKMSLAQKFLWIVKLTISILTMGIVFPNVMED